MTLDFEDVEAIAQRVAELLRLRVAIGLVGVDDVVARFSVSRSYVYEHAEALGAIRLGEGRRRACASTSSRSPRPCEAPGGR